MQMPKEVATAADALLDALKATEAFQTYMALQ